MRLFLYDYGRKKKMKRTLLFILIFLLSSRVGIYADDSIQVELDGTLIAFDTAPIVKNGTTLVPLRAIFEALGASVEWNGETKTVTSQLEDVIITLKIDEVVAYKNGVEMILAQPAQVVDNRTLVPVRFIAESFGLEVAWNGETNTVIIHSNKTLLENEENKYFDDEVPIDEVPSEEVDRREELRRIDTNNNGKVTIAEAEAAGYEMPIYSDHWLYQYMTDRDGDGVVGE